MGIPFRQVVAVGAYVLRQHLKGRKRYPLVLMLEPLFQLQSGLRRLRQDRLSRRDPQQAPVGRRRAGRGRRMRRAGRGHGGRRAAAARGSAARSSGASSPAGNSPSSAPTRSCWRRRSTSTSRARISPGRSISTATGRCTTGRSARQGVYDRAVAALKAAKAKGFRVTINCTFFNDADPARVAAFFDDVTGSASTASRSRRATPTSARPTRSIS